MGITKRSKQHLMQREKKELKLVAFSMKSTGRRSIYCVMAQPTLFTILQRFFFHCSLSAPLVTFPLGFCYFAPVPRNIFKLENIHVKPKWNR